MNPAWRWAILALLGAYHGLNPAMGWLFALALGLQEKSRRAVLAALFPIALGHAAAIAVAILILSFVQHLFPAHALKWPVAGIIFALGVYRLFRASHPRGAGMRVGGRDLFVWSFLMASAHGAGIMLMPVLLAQPTASVSHAVPPAMQHSMQHEMPGSITGVDAPLSMSAVILTTLVHTTAMLVVAAILALVFFEFYDKFGLGLLRRTWFNFDLLWAVALLIAGVAVLLMF